LDFLKIRCAVDTVLATIDWSHAILRCQGVGSGYALDKGDHSGRYAKYLRGDASPSIYEVLRLERECPGTRMRFLHPLYELLSQPWIIRLERFLWTLQPWLQCRVVGTSGLHLSGVMTLKATRRRLLDLTVQGDGFALTALLIYSILAGRARDEVVMLTAKERSWQCLLICLASGEFFPLTRLLTARVRQQILDKTPDGMLCLDTATPDPVVIVAKLKEMAPDLQHVTGATRRRRIRSLLEDGEFKQLVTLERISTAQLSAKRTEAFKSLDLDSEPRGRLGHVATLGSRGRTILEDAYEAYWGQRNCVAGHRAYRYRSISKAWPYRRMLMGCEDSVLEPFDCGRR
jgi:hypothetical protein